MSWTEAELLEQRLGELEAKRDALWEEWCEASEQLSALSPYTSPCGKDALKRATEGFRAMGADWASGPSKHITASHSLDSPPKER